jgi:hypothetical protein
MKRVELAAIRCKAWTWEAMGEGLTPALDGLGYSLGTNAQSVHVEMLDRGADGRVLVLDDGALARRMGLALATRTKSAVDVYEVVATGGAKNRFRPTAWKATAEGELRSAEGVELDLENPEGWTGDLREQAEQVLDAFAGFGQASSQRELRSFKKRKVEKASSPRVAALLAALQKAKRHEAVPQPEARVELRIELAAGGNQRSYCSAAEYEELQKLLGS